MALERQHPGSVKDANPITLQRGCPPSLGMMYRDWPHPGFNLHDRHTPQRSLRWRGSATGRPKPWDLYSTLQLTPHDALSAKVCTHAESTAWNNIIGQPTSSPGRGSVTVPQGSAEESTDSEAVEARCSQEAWHCTWQNISTVARGQLASIATFCLDSYPQSDSVPSVAKRSLNEASKLHEALKFDEL